MSRGVHTGMVNLPTLKLDAIMKAIDSSSMRANHIKDFIAKFNNGYDTVTFELVPSTIHQRFPSKDSMILLNHGKNLFAHGFDVRELKE